MSEKTIFDVIVLVQDGKVVDVPASDNYQVHPADLPGILKIDSQAVLRELRAAYPKCAFNWFAEPVPKAATEAPQGDGKTEGTETPKGDGTTEGTEETEKRQDAASTILEPAAEEPARVAPPTDGEPQPDRAEPPAAIDQPDQTAPGKKRKQK